MEPQTHSTYPQSLPPVSTTPQTTQQWSDHNFISPSQSPAILFLNKLFVVPLALHCKCTWSNQYPHLPIIIVYLIVCLYSTKLGFSLLTFWRNHHLFWRSKDQISGVQFLRLGPELFFQNQWLQHPPVHYSAIQHKYVLDDSVQWLPVKPWTWCIGWCIP